jgi:tetratricopeptide (TPR) repeat protein
LTSDLAQIWESPGVKGNFKFTDRESFRLFVEGMKGLLTYEQSAEPEGLRTAETKLAKCVAQYPRDVLPQFYLGVVKVFRGYDGVGDAVRVFESFASGNVPELRAPAMYNLASAYIENYTPESLDRARYWLNKCIAELGKAASPERLTLRFQAEVVLLFYEIRQQLWVKRKDPRDALKAEIDHVAPDLDRKLNEFLKKLNAATKIPATAREVIMADYWNDRGLLEEFQAWTASDDKTEKELAQTSVRSYERSLELKVNWIPPKSNMARVYEDLLGDFDFAIKCWREVQQTRPGDNYAEYMLGRLFEKRGDEASAISHYKQAPHIPEAGKKLAEIYEKLGRRDEATVIWSNILAKHPGDKDALAAQLRLSFPTPTPASSAPPKV